MKATQTRVLALIYITSSKVSLTYVVSTSCVKTSNLDSDSTSTGVNECEGSCNKFLKNVQNLDLIIFLILIVN